MRLRFVRIAFVVLAASLASESALRAGGARLTIVPLDLPGFGFADTTPAVPVGGNPGTTLGEQRLIAMRRAAEIWGTQVDSSIEIRVQASFASLTCDATSSVLATAGPVQSLQDFPEPSTRGPGTPRRSPTNGREQICCRVPTTSGPTSTSISEHRTASPEPAGTTASTTPTATAWTSSASRCTSSPTASVF